MYTTIKGRYENGKVILEEEAPANEAEVLVTFTSVSVNGKENKASANANGQQLETSEEQKKTRQFGFAKGIVTYMADDFDEPLEEMKDYM